METDIFNNHHKSPCPPHPNINLLLENKTQPPKTVAFSEQTKDEELEEELKDNISHLDFMHTSRKPSYMTNKNPYSLLQQPILKRFSNNQLIRDSLSPRVSTKVKSEAFLSQRTSDYGAKLSENQYPSPRQHFSVDEYTTRNKSKSNKIEKIEKISEIDDNSSYSIYEGKSRNSLITNIDDYLRSFSANSLSNKEKTTKNAEEEEITGTFQENLLRNINDEQNELANEERKVLYDYLMDFMVISLDDNNEEDLENNFLLDEEGEKMQKELNDIPGLYKKLKITTGMKECAFLQVAKMNELEKIKIDFELYPDEFPLLSLRKNILLLTRFI